MAAVASCGTWQIHTSNRSSPVLRHRAGSVIASSPSSSGSAVTTVDAAVVEVPFEAPPPVHAASATPAITQLSGRPCTRAG